MACSEKQRSNARCGDSLCALVLGCLCIGLVVVALSVERSEMLADMLREADIKCPEIMCQVQR